MKFKKASADEVRAKRSQHVAERGAVAVMVKGFKSPRSWNPEDRSANFVMSSESIDRYGDIIVQSGLDTDRFMENPIGLLFHNSRSWPCGNWSDVTKVLSGRPKRTEGKLTFLPEGTDEDADRAARHVAAGVLRTTSIGFAPDWEEVEFILDDDEDWTGGFRFNKSELLECSVVPIPAQPDALVKDAGGDHRLALDLVEYVLDNYAMTPEGLLLPMDEYRAKHLDLVGKRSFFVVDKGLARAKAEPACVPAADRKLQATTDEESATYKGAKVIFDKADPANKEFPASEWLEDAGEVIDSWIVSEGENKGVHALAVEFITGRGLDGMMNGVRASRFLLAELPQAKSFMTDEEIDAFVKDLPADFTIARGEEHESKVTVIALHGGKVIRSHEHKFLSLLDKAPTDADFLATSEAIAARVNKTAEPEEDPECDPDEEPEEATEAQTSVEEPEAAAAPVEAPIKDVVIEAKDVTIDEPNKVVVRVDTEEATKSLNGLLELAGRVKTALAGIFKHSEPAPRVEPEIVPPPAPPTEAEKTATYERAAAVQARLAKNGLVEA